MNNVYPSVRVKARSFMNNNPQLYDSSRLSLLEEALATSVVSARQKP